MNTDTYWLIILQLLIVCVEIFTHWRVTSSRPIRRKHGCMAGLTVQFLWLVVFVCVKTWYLLPLLVINGYIWHRGYKKAKWISEHNRRSGYRIKLYMSHPIRGSKIDEASLEIQLSNSQRAKDASFEIMTKIEALDIYTPGNAEDFVGLTYSEGLLTDKQILDIDCKILDKCDGLIVYDFDKSKGVETEVAYAKKHNMPILRFEKLNSKTIDRIQKFVNDLMYIKKG